MKDIPPFQWCRGYGVIAGRRRYFALTEIAKETGTNPLVPCAVMSEEDAASAIEASIIENVARLPATEMEQYVAFRKLADEGKAPEDIATFFGVTELLVRRVLALAGLAAPIRKLYAEDEIDRETIRALTLATPARDRRGWAAEKAGGPGGQAARARREGRRPSDGKNHKLPSPCAGGAPGQTCRPPTPAGRGLFEA